MKINKKISLVLIAIGLVIILVALLFTFNNKKSGDNPKESKTLNYNLERAMFYKEVEKDGKKVISELDEGDLESVCSLSYSLQGNDYTETSFDMDNPYIVEFKSKKDDHKLTVMLDSGFFVTYHDIVESDKNNYDKIEVNEDYKIGNTNVLRKEYSIFKVNHLEYYYLYKNGFYIKYAFEAKEDYKFDYDSLEKLLSFDVKEQSL